MYFFPFFHHSNLSPIKRPMGAIKSHLFRGWIFTNFAEHIENSEKIPQ
jgi:hypothetical protein